MKIVVIDNDQAISVLQQQISRVVVEGVLDNHFLVDKDDSAYHVALKFIQSHYEADYVIFINLHLECKNDKDELIHPQHQGGLEVLQYLRLISEVELSDTNIVKNTIRCAHVVMYSPLTIEDAIRLNKSSILLCSEGASYLRLLSPDNELVSIIDHAKSISDIQSLKSYFRVDFNLPDDRHAWANWWGVKQLYDAHGVNKILYPQYLKSKLKELQSLKAIYLYEPTIPIKAKEHKIKNPRILYIDDQWKNGWSDIFVCMLYDENIKSSDGEYKLANGKTVFKAVAPNDIKPCLQDIETHILNFGGNGDNPDLILLDLRLTTADQTISSHNVQQCSGAKLLKQIREKYMGIPVLMTTASNKAWSYQNLLQIGADAYWIKGGLDENRSSEEIVNNYLLFLDLVEKLMGEKYQLLKLFARRIEELKNIQTLWWVKAEWRHADEDTILRQTNVKKSEIFSMLYECFIMTRSFLQLYVMESGYNDVHSSSKFMIQFWASGIIQRLSFIIEAVHNFKDFGKNGQEANSTLMSKTYEFRKGTKGEKIMPGRNDRKGRDLYHIRNEASHYAYLQNLTSDEWWKKLSKYIDELLTYLIDKPSEVK